MTAIERRRRHKTILPTPLRNAKARCGLTTVFHPYARLHQDQADSLVRQRSSRLRPLGKPHERWGRFFSSYNRGESKWSYTTGMGTFTQMLLPLADSVTLKIQCVNSTKVETVTKPPYYRSRINPTTVPLTDSKSFRARNSVAVDGMNGIDINAPDTLSRRSKSYVVCCVIGWQTYQPFDIAVPATVLCDPKRFAIVSNGRCASLCSLFSITMAKEEGARTVVYGGKRSVQQEYCGTVGGQSTDFSMIDMGIESEHLKSNPAALPDLYMSLTFLEIWREKLKLM